MEENIFKIVVDFDNPMACLKKIHLGKGSNLHLIRFEEEFHVQGSGKQEVEVIACRMNHKFSVNESLRELDRRNLKPASVEHAFAFIAENCEMLFGEAEKVKQIETWRGFSIFVLSCTGKIMENFNFAFTIGTDRSINMGCLEKNYPTCNRFSIILAVRK